MIHITLSLFLQVVARILVTLNENGQRLLCREYAASSFKYAALSTQKHHHCERLCHRLLTSKKMDEYVEAKEKLQKGRGRDMQANHSFYNPSDSCS
jgi:hypothetical protein